MNFTRLFDILPYQQHRYPQATALSGRENGSWRSWSTAQILSECDSISAGLLEAGLHPGDRIGILAHCGSPQWAIADVGMMQVGMIPVPIHATCRPDEISHIMQDANLKGCFVSNREMLNKLKTANLPLPHLFSFEPIEHAPEVTPWHALACIPDEHWAGKIQYYRDGIPETALATILYTSGTTGLPKGVMLTHQNIVSNIKSVMAIIPVGPSTTVVSYLPLSHIFERMVTYLYQAAGAPVWYADSVENLPEILQQVRPHFLTAVPRILEKMEERLLELRNAAGPLKRRILDWALSLGERYPYSGTYNMPLPYRLQRMAANLLVYRHWRKRMGGRLKYITVGAAALQPRLGRLFSAAGIEVREGYGLTETSPVVSFNRFEPGGVHFGTVGIPAPGVEVRIAHPDEDGNGEIEVRGLNVMAGYHGLPEETQERYTEDGWFKTGDAGRFEHKRFLRITGRKSEIFKTTSGKFIAPAFIEQQLSTSSFVSQCMAVGANQPYPGALIVPNFAHLEAWCRENKVHWTAPQYMVLTPKVEKLFQAEINRLNETQLSSVEKIRAFKLLHEPWTPENGLLTPTLKLRRDAIAKQFSGEIKGLFV
jgi:long-chain acyl-CoA synthetase